MIPDPWAFALAFIIAPVIVVGVGYVAVLLHERASPRHPAE
jgi:hypothetical protein